MQLIFIFISVITLVSAVQVVTNRNLFHAALYMMLSFVGVAGLYALLEAGFMAATQLLVYIGAISILVIFAIMMTRRLMQTTESPYNSQWIWGGIAAVLTFGLLTTVILQVLPLDDGFPLYNATTEAAIQNSVVNLGQSFVSADQFVLPFELASVLLLAALVGAIIVARPDVEDEE